MRICWLVLIVVLANTGCYRYSETTLDRLSPGTEIRARLTAAEAERFRAHVPAAGRVFDGRFIGWSGDRVLVEVPVLRDLRGMRMETLHQRLDFAATEVVEVEARQLDRARTALIVGAGLLVAALVVGPQLGPGESSPPPEGGEPPNEDRLVIRLVIPVGR